MKKIYFLDRNAVSDIKKNINKQSIKIERLAKLRSIDKKDNIVSSILSIREGQSKHIETKEEIQKSISKDTPAIKKFYKKAKTDTEFFQKNISTVSKTFELETGKESLWDSYIKLIIKAKNDLYQPIKKLEREKYTDDFLEYCTNLNVPIGHPIVLCCLSALYGNINAHKILKPKKNLSTELASESAYNTVNDLIIISRLCFIHNLINKSPEKKIMVKLITFDKPIR